MSRLLGILIVVAVVSLPQLGHADSVTPSPPPSVTQPQPPLAPLLERMSKHAAQFEEMKRRGSFTISGQMDELDSSGHVDGRREMVVRFMATPSERFTEVVRYLEDGTDKTAEARQKASIRRAERRSGKIEKTRDLHLPFLASEQGRYTFTFLERDPVSTSRVRVGFVPRAPAEDAFKGSAWVDESSGEILTMGFSPSKNPRFVDHIDVTIRFDLPTPLGRAPSRIEFDARGGFLVIHKHYRGSATISDPRIAF